ncbi:hypothetical protein [Streptomyces sp. T028]
MTTTVLSCPAILELRKDRRDRKRALKRRTVQPDGTPEPAGV